MDKIPQKSVIGSQVVPLWNRKLPRSDTWSISRFIFETLGVTGRWVVEMVSKGDTMFSSTESRRLPFNPSARGYHAVYHDGEVNHCPGCGRTHWLIGRLSAECAFCSTALPLREAYNQGPAAAPVFWTSRPDYAELNAA